MIHRRPKTAFFHGKCAGAYPHHREAKVPWMHTEIIINGKESLGD